MLALAAACLSPVAAETVTPTQEPVFAAASSREKPLGFTGQQQQFPFNESGLIEPIGVRRGISSDAYTPAAKATAVEAKQVAPPPNLGVVWFMPESAVDWGCQGALTLALYMLGRSWKRKTRGRQLARW